MAKCLNTFVSSKANDTQVKTDAGDMQIVLFNVPSGNADNKGASNMNCSCNTYFDQRFNCCFGTGEQ